MSIRSLVIAEHDGAELYAGVYNTVTAARALGGETHLLIAGDGVDAVAAAGAKIDGLGKVLVADHAVYARAITENLAALIAANAAGYTHILAAASTFGKALIPYVAALLDAQAVSDISEIVSPDTFTRPIYAGNAVATVRSGDAIKLLTVRATAFDAAAGGGAAAVENLDAAEITDQVEFIEQTVSGGERPELTSARVVVSGGRGMQNGENFAMLEKLADQLGGAVGASRAAVDAGFVPNEYQVGQTGKVVAPDLYVAVGISGAIQHLAGMKDSKCIVAINNDAEAPIFQVADYSWNADLFTAVPELQAELEK